MPYKLVQQEPQSNLLLIGAVVALALFLLMRPKKTEHSKK
jgi:hypothetical protein